MTEAKPARYAVFAALILIYILLRFWGLTSSCLWFDEVFSIHAAQHSWNTLLNFVAQDLIHPPLFYILLKAWMTIGGDSLLWLRLFPIVFSVLALIPFFLICRELKLKFTTIALALFIFAVNGSLIKYSQEVRMYAPLLCFSLFSLWLYLRFFRSGKGIIALAIISALMVYTHYFGWLVILSQIIITAWFRREHLRKVGLMLAGLVFAFCPWILLIFQASPAGEKFAQNIGWMQRPGPITFFQFILNLVEPIYFKASSADYSSNYIVSVTLLVAITFCAFNYFKHSHQSEQDTDHKVPSLLLVLVGVPVLLALIASWLLPYSVWGVRHLIIVFVPTILLVAFIVEHGGKHRTYGISAFICIAIIAFGIQLYRSNVTYIWCGWETLASNVEALPAPHGEPTRIYVFEDLAAYHFWFALRKVRANFEVDKLEGIEKIKEDKAYFLPRGFDEVKRVNIEDLKGEKFWIVFRDTKWDSNGSPLFDLTLKGYGVTQHSVFDAGREKAYLVLVEKKE